MFTDCKKFTKNVLNSKTCLYRQFIQMRIMLIAIMQHHTKISFLTLTVLSTAILPQNPTKYALYYHPMFHHADFYTGTGHTPFEKCPIFNNCFITPNKSLLDPRKWSAILFHMAEPPNWTQPKVRDPSQRYIFYNLEAPTSTLAPLRKFANFFNWTMTYRRDSDVYRPYARFVPQSTNYTPPKIEQILARPRKIAWFVSHCNAKSQRDKLAKAIAQFLPVDIYGKCGKFECKHKKRCLEMLQLGYKFYLSFENSICQDYVTEKSFDVMKYNVLPVVLAGVNASEFFPPKSVIDVRGYVSVEKLGEHLVFLDRNPEEYVKYFAWKQNYVIESGKTVGMCNLCAKLNEEGKVGLYSDVDRWWKKGGCNNSFVEQFIK